VRSARGIAAARSSWSAVNPHRIDADAFVAGTVEIAGPDKEFDMKAFRATISSSSRRRMASSRARSA
jgi:hypothetical protein